MEYIKTRLRVDNNVLQNYNVMSNIHFWTHMLP